MQLFSFRKSILLIGLLITGSISAQELGSETVVVVKPYTPSVNDALKIRELPGISDTLSLQKKPVQYSVFSVPVASTFTPAKGRAADLERSRPLQVYDNYAMLGAGNYTSVLAELSSNVEVNRTDNFGLFLTHNSSQGGIEDVWMEDKYYDTELNLNYTSRQRNMSWKTEAGFEHQLYNWYGIPAGIFPELDQNFKAQQNYYSFYAGGDLNFDDSFFENLRARYRYFGDRFHSTEHRVEFSPSLEIPIGGELFNTELLVDYVKGSFERQYATEVPVDYSSLNLGLSSGLVVLRDDLTLNLGAAVYYNYNGENGGSSVFVYPEVTASYRMAGEYFVAYAGLEGELKQNSYYGFAQENPFISPTLYVLPTDEQYKAYLGAKGKLSNSIGYNLRANLASEDNKPLFRSNFPSGTVEREEYAYGNSFRVVYDNVNTFSGFGELNIEVNRDFMLRVNGEYFAYDTSREQEAWNLPEFKASLLADYQIGENWSAGANLFFVGERKDYRGTPSLANPGYWSQPHWEVVSLDSYLDLNANIGYMFNDQLSAFVKGQNLLGNNYERWVDYPVLGLQVLAGVTYKFDF